MRKIGFLAVMVTLVPVWSVAQVTPVPGYAVVSAPIVVSSVPSNNDRTVNPNLKLVRLTFNQAMDVALFNWTLPPPSNTFPVVPTDPYWSNGNTVLNIPVQLGANRTYVIPLNVGQQVFRSAAGVPLPPVELRFATALTATVGTRAGTGGTGTGGAGTYTPAPGTVPYFSGSSGAVGTRGRSGAAPAATPASTGTGSSGSAPGSGAIRPAARPGVVGTGGRRAPATATPTP